MKQERGHAVDLHPKRYIFAQIVWIIFGTGVLYQGLRLIGKGWAGGETYVLPLGLAFAVIGATIVVSRLFLVNSAVGRLESKMAPSPDASELERSPLSSERAL